MVSEIDFLPAEYWQQRASQRDQWYILTIGVVALMMLLGSMLNQTRKSANLRAQLQSLESEYDDVLAQITEVQRLEERRAALAQDAKLFATLTAYPAVSRVLVTVATSCPAQLTLHSIRIKSIRPSGAERKQELSASRPPGPAGQMDFVAESLERLFTERTTTQVTLEIIGVADSDLEVAELIERLERSDCFALVTLADSGSQPVGISSVRGFKIQCLVEKTL